MNSNFYNSYSQSEIRPAIAVALGVALFLAVVLLGANVYGRYAGVSRGKGAILLLLALLGAAVPFDLYWLRHGDLPPRSFGFQGGAFALDPREIIILAIIFPFVLAPFLAKLYTRWMGGAATEAEKAPGMDGVRAWLRGGNLVCAVLISFCVWQIFGYSFWTILTLTLMVLLAYPVCRMASTSVAPAPSKNDDLSPERERVLKMLDEGKISAADSAELLNALGHTVPSRPAETAAAEPHHKMTLVGVGVLMIAFFLPWRSINLGHAMGQAMNDAQQAVVPQGWRAPIDFGSAIHTGTVNYTGADMPHGLGVIALILGIAAAALPYLTTNLDAVTRRKISLVGLGAGALILIYLLTDHLHFASAGLLLALAGYALEFIGIFKEQGTDARWLRPAPARSL